MKEKWRQLQCVFLFTIIWMILNENARFTTVILGLVLSGACILVTNRMLHIRFADEFYLPLLPFLFFIVRLFAEIYAAGAAMTFRIIRGEIQPSVHGYKSSLKRPLLLGFLSNAITLTPGTITISREEDELIILSADRNEAEVAGGIRKGLEKYLEKIEED